MNGNVLIGGDGGLEYRLGQLGGDNLHKVPLDDTFRPGFDISGLIDAGIAAERSPARPRARPGDDAVDRGGRRQPRRQHDRGRRGRADAQADGRRHARRRARRDRPGRARSTTSSGSSPSPVTNAARRALVPDVGGPRRRRAHHRRRLAQGWCRQVDRRGEHGRRAGPDRAVAGRGRRSGPAVRRRGDDARPQARSLDRRCVRHRWRARHPDAQDLSRCARSGLWIVAAPDSPAAADAIEPSHVQDLLRVLARAFRYVVVDTGSGLDEPTLAAMEVATDAVFVSSLDDRRSAQHAQGDRDPRHGRRASDAAPARGQHGGPTLGHEARGRRHGGRAARQCRDPAVVRRASRWEQGCAAGDQEEAGRCCRQGDAQRRHRPHRRRRCPHESHRAARGDPPADPQQGPCPSPRRGAGVHTVCRDDAAEDRRHRATAGERRLAPDGLLDHRRPAAASRPRRAVGDHRGRTGAADR